MRRGSLTGLSNDWCHLFAAMILFVWLFAGISPITAHALDQEDNFTLLERLGRESALELVDQLDYKSGVTIYLVAQNPHPANWVMERALADLLTQRGHQVVCSSSDDSVLPPVATGAAAQNTNSVPEVVVEENVDDDNEDSGDDDDSDSDAPSSGNDNGADNGQVNTGPNTGGAPQTPGGGLMVQTQSRSQTSTPAEDFFKNRLPVRGEVLAYQIVDLSVSYPWSKRTWMIGSLKYGRICSARIRADHYTEPGHIFQGESHADRIAIDEFPGWAKPYLEGENYPFPIATAEPPSVRRILEPVAVGVIISGLVYLFFENQK